MRKLQLTPDDEDWEELQEDCSIHRWIANGRAKDAVQSSFARRLGRAVDTFASERDR